MLRRYTLLHGVHRQHCERISGVSSADLWGSESLKCWTELHVKSAEMHRINAFYDIHIFTFHFLWGIVDPQEPPNGRHWQQFIRPPKYPGIVFCSAPTYLWSSYVIGQTIYIFMLFLLSSFFFYFLAISQPSEIRCLPYFHTWCGLSANLECAARGWLKIQDAKMTQKIAIWAPSHNFVGLYLRK